MFLSPADFMDKPYKVPNSQEEREWPTFIEKKEAEYLKCILGLTLYNEFMIGIEASPPIEQRWLNLRYGTNPDKDADGSYDNGKYEYLGLVDLLKPAIYSDWVRHNYRTWTASGMVVTTAQNNSESVNPNDEIVQSWNDFVNKLSGWPHRRKNTFYGFMKAYPEEYEDWFFGCRYRYKNSLDF